MATGTARDELVPCAARIGFLTAVALVLLATDTGQARSASPCARNANQTARYCATICRVARRLDQAACVPRDEACVVSCRTHLSGCRETAGIESDTLLCISSFEAARVACLGQFPDPSSPSFLACLEAARKDAVSITHARRAARRGRGR